MTEEKRHPTRIRVAALITDAQGKVLMVRHQKEGRDYWLLPGGGVEQGESLEQALIRELQEETGLTITLGPLVLVNDSIPPDGHRHILQLVFRATVTGGTLECMPDHRLREACYTTTEDLKMRVVFPDIKKEIVQLAEGEYLASCYIGNIWLD